MAENRWVTALVLVVAVVIGGILERAVSLRYRTTNLAQLNLQQNDFSISVSHVPPCPAMGSDASNSSWDLWRANFPDAKQCIIIIDVPGR